MLRKFTGEGDGLATPVISISLVVVSSIVFSILFLFGPGTAGAVPSLGTAFGTAYPNSASDDNVVDATGTNSQLCHVSLNGGQPWNAYGWAMRVELQAGATASQALAMIEAANSDQDPTGATNIDEITANAQPGWTDGAANTYFLSSGTTVPNQTPPGDIQGVLDASPPQPVPALGLIAQLGLAISAITGARLAMREKGVHRLARSKGSAESGLN